MRPLLHIRRAFLIAVMVALALPGAISAYAGQIPANVTITGPVGTIQCGQLYEFQATVFESNGTRVTQQQVLWTIVSAPLGANDTISPSTVTDNNGVARGSAQFGGAAGQRTIRATAGNAFAQIVVDPAGCGSPPPLAWSIGTCASALGNTTTGPFSPSTKVQSLGGYITFRLSFGPDYAGKTVLVTRALRGVPFRGWGSFFGGTLRIADANGDVYYAFRSRTAAWISVRGLIAASDGDGPAISRACQGRWR